MYTVVLEMSNECCSELDTMHVLEISIERFSELLTAREANYNMDHPNSKNRAPGS